MAKIKSPKLIAAYTIIFAFLAIGATVTFLATLAMLYPQTIPFAIPAAFYAAKPLFVATLCTMLSVYALAVATDLIPTFLGHHSSHRQDKVIKHNKKVDDNRKQYQGSYQKMCDAKGFIPHSREADEAWNHEFEISDRMYVWTLFFPLLERFCPDGYKRYVLGTHDDSDVAYEDNNYNVQPSQNINSF